MNRNLRKRHLFIWILLTAVVISLLFYARANTPTFPGDQSTINVGS